MSKNCGLSDVCDTSSGSIRKCTEHEHDIGILSCFNRLA